MKTFKDYIYENKLFEEQCDKYLVDINSNNHEYYEIDEGVIDWFKNLFKKTGSFLEKWFKRGGKKVQASENLGSFKMTEKPIKLDNINSLNAQFKNGIYSKIFVNANSYLSNYKNYIIDEYSSNFENDINVHVIYFIPQYAFEDEKYPVSIIIYSDKIKLKEGQNGKDQNGIHIFNFDMSNAITGVSESQMFKIFIKQIDTKNILSYVTYSVKDTTLPPEIKKINYDGKKFEEHAEKYAIMTIINNK